MKPEIYAKASLTHEQISTKEKIGCDGIEVQLLNELVSNRNRGSYRKATDAFNLNELGKYNVKVVHAPIIKGQGDVTLEVLVDNKDIFLLTQIFAIADFYGKLYNRQCIVVVHSESYYDIISDIGDVWNRIVDSLSGLLGIYQNVDLVIENVSPFRGIDNIGKLHLANNFGFDNITMVTKLREELNTDRIGTCLDTCHAMLANKYISILYDAIEDLPREDFSLERYFRENKELIKLVHLSNIKDSGYGKGKHGIPFNEESYFLLKSILGYYEKYNYSVPITLEVEETNYDISDGYKSTKDLVDRYYAEKAKE